MLKGNINFNVNVDLYINDIGWDKARIEECNKNAVSDRFQKAIICSIHDLLAPAPIEDATVTIDKYTYTNLYEVKEE